MTAELEARADATAPSTDARPPGARPPARPRAAAERRPSSRRRRWREARPALLFLSPWIAGFLVFTAWPMIYSAYLSLTATVPMIILFFLAQRRIMDGIAATGLKG